MCEEAEGEEIKTVLEVGQKDVYVSFDETIWQNLSTLKIKIKNQCKGYRLWSQSCDCTKKALNCTFLKSKFYGM